MALTKIDGEFTSPDFADQDIVTTGDVGIGTTAPIANLDIAYTLFELSRSSTPNVLANTNLVFVFL